MTKWGINEVTVWQSEVDMSAYVQIQQRGNCINTLFYRTGI